MTEEEAKTELPSNDEIDRIRRYNMALDGEDPEMQQSINKFMKMDNPIERSNLQLGDIRLITYCEYTGMSYFPDLSNDPFRDLSRAQATSLMAKGGMKSEQVVRILQKGIDVSELVSRSEPEKRGFLDRIRGSKEE